MKNNIYIVCLSTPDPPLTKWTCPPLRHLGMFSSCWLRIWNVFHNYTNISETASAFIYKACYNTWRG